MTPRCVVVRPEPGNARTADRLRDLGIDVVRCPLFAVAPVAWDVPDPGQYGALLLTSANAIRHGSAGLARLASLPVVAVGAATAAAARAAGFTVAITGAGDAQDAITLAGEARLGPLLHLAGRDRIATDVAAITVYASDPLPIAPAAVADWRGSTILLHSARAARRVAALAGERSTIALLALSEAILAAAGTGWRRVDSAAQPTDAALIDRLRGSAD